VYGLAAHQLAAIRCKYTLAYEAAVTAELWACPSQCSRGCPVKSCLPACEPLTTTLYTVASPACILSVCMQLPWRTQLWVGPIEVLIISTAMVLASGHWPTVQEAVQLLAYGWVECVVPLFAVRWQQRLGLQPTTPQPSTAADQLPAVEEQQQDLCMPCVDGAPQPALGTGGGGGAGGSTGPGPAGAQVQQEQLPRHQDRPESNLQQQDQHPVAGSPPVPPVPQGTTLSVLDLVQAVQNRGTTLYTSPLQHRAISIKVSRACGAAYSPSPGQQ
jgi:hypothetical protein